MKSIVVLILLVLATNNLVVGQDLIVTAKGDSLNCKITKIKADFTYFTFKYEGEVRNTLLATDQIKYLKKDFYELADVLPEQVSKYDGDYDKFRIAASGGWSHRTARISDEIPTAFQDYIKKLKSGYHLGGDATYFASELVGVGLKYSRYRAKSQLSYFYVVDTITGRTAPGNLSEDITIQYFAPAVYLRFNSKNKKSQIITDLSMGYMSYKDEVNDLGKLTVRGSTVGLSWGIGADFSIDPDLSLGFSFTYLIGALSRYDVDDGNETASIQLENGNYEGLSRIDLSAGLRWYLK
ncbi:MAG: outer membrane beta-barrel protein [Flavobacteriales bacterium]